MRLWAAEAGVTLSKQKSWGYAAKIPGTQIVVGVTTGYMNTSGGPVAGLAKYYKCPAERVVIVHDDLDLDLGTVRLKKGGGHGGHNGLRDIHKALGTPEYLRVRLGIGRPPGRMEPAAYVLKPFASNERDVVSVMQHQAIEATTMLIDQGLLAAQQRFHSPEAS